MLGKLRKLWIGDWGHKRELTRLKRDLAKLVSDRDDFKLAAENYKDSSQRRQKSLEASMQREFALDKQVDELAAECRNVRESWAQTVTDMNKVIADRSAAEELLDEAAATINALHRRFDAMADLHAALAHDMRRKSP